MRDQWACPDRGRKKPGGLYNPIPGSTSEFDDCPAYYLRRGGDRPAEHLINGVTHPADLTQAWAFEVEVGARLIDSLSPKGIDAIHLHFSEKRSREVLEDELRKRKGRS